MNNIQKSLKKSSDNEANLKDQVTKLSKEKDDEVEFAMNK